MCACEYRYLWKPQVLDHPGAGIIDGCKLPEVGVLYPARAIYGFICWVLSPSSFLVYLKSLQVIHSTVGESRISTEPYLQPQHCTSCSHRYHMECLDPPLQEVPVDEWFCPEGAAPGVAPTHGNVLSFIWVSLIVSFREGPWRKSGLHQGEGFLWTRR